MIKAGSFWLSWLAVLPYWVASSYFQDTTPLIGWTSSSGGVKHVNYLHGQDLVDSIHHIPGCQKWNIILQQPHLSATDLDDQAQSLDFIRESISKHRSLSISYADTRFPNKEIGARKTSDVIIEALRSLCGDVSIHSSSSPESLQELPQEGTVVTVVTLPSSSLKQCDQLVKKYVEQAVALGREYSVYLTSDNKQQTLQRRAVASTPLPFSKRPIIQRYVFFNTGLFSGLFAVFLLLGILVVAFQAVSSLQTPTRFEAKYK